MSTDRAVATLIYALVIVLLVVVILRVAEGV